MKTLENLRAKLARIGATMDDSADNFVVCDAPSGYVWNANSEPSMTIHFANTAGQSWIAEAVRYESKSLAMGLRKVTDVNRMADIRWNLGDDNWGSAADGPDRIEWPKKS